MKLDFSHTVRPENGSFKPLEEGTYNLSLGNGTCFQVVLLRDNDRICFGVIGRGIYCFDRYVHPNYVKEKMSKLLIGDCENIADFLNDQLCCYDVPRFGRYNP